MLMAYEVTKDLPTEPVEIETPLERMTGRMVSDKKLTLVPILRAGLGMVDGVSQLLPTARVGHIGVARDEISLEPMRYYAKLPRRRARARLLRAGPDARHRRLRHRRGHHPQDRGRPPDPFPLHRRGARGRAAHARGASRRAGLCRRARSRSSTSTASSCPGWATPATGCSAPDDHRGRCSLAALAAQEPLPPDRVTFDDLPLGRSSAPVALQESVTVALLDAIIAPAGARDRVRERGQAARQRRRPRSPPGPAARGVARRGSRARQPHLFASRPAHHAAR